MTPMTVFGGTGFLGRRIVERLTLARVLDEVEVFVGSNLLDADEHGPIPDCSQATTSNRYTSRPIAYLRRENRVVLAPQIDSHPADPRNSAMLMSPKAQ
jgi:uncharacterized protein YbjT (DUF2867 family)